MRITQKSKGTSIGHRFTNSRSDHATLINWYVHTQYNSLTSTNVHAEQVQGVCDRKDEHGPDPYQPNANRLGKQADYYYLSETRDPKPNRDRDPTTIIITSTGIRAVFTPLLTRMHTN